MDLNWDNFTHVRIKERFQARPGLLAVGSTMVSEILNEHRALNCERRHRTEED
jgi:hypothetical protein